MTLTHPETGQMVGSYRTDIDPRLLLVDLNIRADLKLDPAFLDSVRELGVLVPIVAVETEDGLRVRYGHRRAAAAVLADLLTVPVVVIPDDEDSERIVRQWAENEHRAGLTVSDQTRAVEQLAAFGLTVDQIAGRTKVAAERIGQALAVSQSKVASKAVKRWDFLSLEHAAALAEFDDDESALTELVAAAKDGRFDHTAQRLRDARERAAKVAAITEDLIAKGVPIIEKYDPWAANTKILALDKLKGPKGKPLTTAQHKKCPGHSAWIPQHGYRDPEVQYLCADYKAHGHELLRPPHNPHGAAKTTTPEQDAEHRKLVIKNNADWRSATTVRKEFLAGLVQRKTAPKGSAAFLAIELANADLPVEHLRQDGPTNAFEILGLGNGATAGYIARSERGKVEQQIGASTEGRAMLVAVGILLLAAERAMEVQVWRGRPLWARRYLSYLAAAGYELSEVEALVLEPSESELREAERDAQRTAAAEAAEAIESEAVETEAVALPVCPDCGATGKRCKRPSGHDASEWHAARRALLAADVTEDELDDDQVVDVEIVEDDGWTDEQD